MTAAQLWAAGSVAWRAVWVRGHRGWLAGRRLIWWQGNQTILFQAACPGAELLAIARSLRRVPYG